MFDSPSVAPFSSEQMASFTYKTTKFKDTRYAKLVADLKSVISNVDFVDYYLHIIPIAVDVAIIHDDYRKTTTKHFLHKCFGLVKSLHQINMFNCMDRTDDMKLKTEILHNTISFFVEQRLKVHHKWLYQKWIQLYKDPKERMRKIIFD